MEEHQVAVDSQRAGLRTEVTRVRGIRRSPLPKMGDAGRPRPDSSSTCSRHRWSAVTHIGVDPHPFRVGFNSTGLVRDATEYALGSEAKLECAQVEDAASWRMNLVRLCTHHIRKT